jgi:hypothetical protein
MSPSSLARSLARSFVRCLTVAADDTLSMRDEGPSEEDLRRLEGDT